jgi:exosome complex component RRP46
MSSECGLLHRADGSASFSQGGTSVTAAVFGPREKRSSRADRADRATVEVEVHGRKARGAKEAVLENILLGTLEPSIITSLHPRLCITIVVQVVEEDGSLIAAAINGATLALLNSGIEMAHVVTSATCAITAAGDVVLDPVDAEERAAAATVTTAVNNTTDGVVLSHTVGAMDEARYFATADETARAAGAVLAFIRLALSTKKKKTTEAKTT